ncbi:MAG: YqaE/Pmp3 family membrane protein [Bacteroidales bacterium]|nr:YqaE/Pmp3 family membrane protein [Bacteroidales bacterium]
MSLLTIVLCVLLPPVAVFMKTGFNSTFLLNVVLSILGWVPGVIHALYVNKV